MSYNNFKMDDKTPIFTTASDTSATSTTESYAVETKPLAPIESVFSVRANAFQPSTASNMMPLFPQPEPKIADTAPPTRDFNEEMLMNLRINDSSNLYEDLNNNQNYFSMNQGAESVSSSNLWGESSSTSFDKNNEVMETFDFLIKSLSSANNFMSMLTREQQSVLRSIRPGALYDFLQEIAKARNEKRSRRVGSMFQECAFCKNNGENEECYTNHVLKDYRGRVLCPVLRAFRCPRCGATGERAHTIKYCPENNDVGSGSFGSRRRSPSASSLLFSSLQQQGNGGVPPATPSSSGAGSLSHSLWNFTLN